MNSTSFTLSSPSYKSNLNHKLPTGANAACVQTHLALDASAANGSTPSNRSSESDPAGRSPSVTVLTAIGSNSFLHHEPTRPFQLIGGGFSLSSRLSLSGKYHRSSWSKTSPLKKLLTITVALFFVVTISLSIGLLSILLSRNNNNNSKQEILINDTRIDNERGTTTTTTRQQVCLTPDCVKVAASVIEAIDISVDPCDDFYMYSCGDWIKSNPLPDGKSSWGSFSKIWQDNQAVMRSILDDSSNFKAGSAEDKARIYYESCLDKNETVEERGAKPMLDLIDRAGGWNISGSSFNVDKWDLAEIIQIFHNQYNRGGLFVWAVNADERNSSRNIIQLDQGGLGLPSRNYYLNKTERHILEAYSVYMNKVAELMGGVNYEEQMKDVLEFEKMLAEITIPPDQRRDDERSYHKFTLRELNKKSPFLNWTKYFNDAFDYHSKTGISFSSTGSDNNDKFKNKTKYSVTGEERTFQNFISKRSITDSEQIVIYTPEYFEDLSYLIIDQLKTKRGKTALANYLVWSVVQSLIQTMPKSFREASRSLRKALIGSEGLEVSWRFCVSDTNQAMGFALSSSFVRKVFQTGSKVRVEEMISSIRTAFKDSLSNLAWMDDKTRQLAKEKADFITQMIGFPDFIMNPDSLNEKYEGLELEEDKYFENTIKVNVLMLRENMEKLSKPANKTEWDMTPSMVNAYYTPTKNQIVFPAGILQTPFYNPKYPNSLNYGAMGVVMGHELTHAFDDQGREYDKNGNLYQWWDNETLKNFEERVKCFVDQYSNYEVDGNNLNGKQSLGENIADNGGIKAAFKAYEKWSVSHEEAQLPGLNLTHRQLFFVGFAQVWCSASTPEALKLQVMNDPHAPARYRVIGTISNSLEFAKEFSCPQNSPMNPNKKCIVW